MIGGKILNTTDLREYVTSMLNIQFEVNISADNIRLDIDESRSDIIPYNYIFNIGIELGSRLPIKPLYVSMDPAMVIISYVEKSTKDGYEFNEAMIISSFIDARMFSL